MLDYNIVWFEDSDDVVKANVEEIKGYLDKIGFNLKLIRKKDDTDFKKIFAENDVDLALIDQNLSNGKKGENIISAVGNLELYTDFVFYSQEDDFPKFTKSWLEGVFYSPRKELLSKTKKIIDLTVKKSLDIYNIRGQFIAESINLSSALEEIIAKIFKLTGKERNFFFDTMVYEEFFSDVNKYKIICEFLRQKLVLINEEITNSATSEERKTELNALNKELSEIKSYFKEFCDKIIPLRNELAHAKITPGKKNTLTVKDRTNHTSIDKSFTNTDCEETRHLFIKQTKNLEKFNLLLDNM